MAKRPRNLWSRDEAIAVLSLYCQIPFGRMNATNPLVQATAEQIGRSPSSVALKLVNFASLDPFHRARGVSGMANVSKLDREVWDQYYGRWETLGDALELQPDPVEPDESTFVTTRPDTERTVEQILRRGQSFFRNAVLSAYDHRCCITGMHCRDLLRASHIVPWSKSVESRLNPANGLCLNVFHDAAFDRGYVTLSEDYRLRLSADLADFMPEKVHTDWVVRFDGEEIRLPDRYRPTQEYLAFHRSNVFKG